MTMKHLIGLAGVALRLLAGLAAAAVVLTLGFAAAGGLLLRLAWLRSRAARVRPPPARRPGRPHAEVIDVQAREVQAR